MRVHALTLAVLAACVQGGKDVPPVKAAAPLAVDAPTQTVSLDPAHVPVVEQCAAGEVVRRSDTGWACVALSAADVRGAATTTDTDALRTDVTVLQARVATGESRTTALEDRATTIEGRVPDPALCTAGFVRRVASGWSCELPGVADVGGAVSQSDLSSVRTALEQRAAELETRLELPDQELANRVRNGSFEVTGTDGLPAGWERVGTGIATVALVPNAYSGAAALSFVDADGSEAGWSGIRQSLLDAAAASVLAGRVFTASVTVLRLNGPHTGQICLRESEGVETCASLGSSSAWSRAVVHHTMSAGPAGLEIRISPTAAPLEGAGYLLDDVMVARGPAAPLYVPAISEPLAVDGTSLQRTGLVLSVNDLGITAAKLADDAVTSAKINDLAVSAGKIADGAVTQGKLASGAVAAANLASGAVTSAKIAAGAVGAQSLADAAVTSAKLADGAVVAAKMATDSVTAACIADGAVSDSKIASGAITEGKIAQGAVVGAAIADGAVAAAKLANDAVSSAKIENLAVTAAKLADGAVVQSKLGAAAVATTHLAANAVTTQKLAAGAVNTQVLGDAAVTSAKLADNAVTSAKLAAGAITWGAISGVPDAVSALVPCPDNSPTTYGFCLHRLSGAMNFRAAALGCKDLGMRLCMLAELSAAQAVGAEWCEGEEGWVADRKDDATGYVAALAQEDGGCPPQGVRSTEQAMSTGFGAYCCR